MAVRTRTDPQGRVRYDIEFQQGQRRVFERTPPGTTLRQAREREIQLRRATYEVDTLKHAPEVLLKDVIQSWLATKPHKEKWHANLVSKANALAPFVMNRPVVEAVEVAKSAAASWTASTGAPQRQSIGRDASARDVRGATSSTSRGTGLAIATINRRLAIIKASLSFAGREDLSRKIKLRREQPKIVYASRGQVLRLARSAKQLGHEQTRILIMLGAYSGLRASELLRSETHTRSGTLSVVGKGDKPRVVPLPPRLLPFLRAWASESSRLSYDSFHKQFTAARKHAGLPAKITPHTLRHSYATWLINAGENLKVVSQLLGHADVQITARHYAHLYDETLKNAVRRLR